MKFWFKSGAWRSDKAVAVAASMQPEAVKSIAIIRHAAVGDIVLTRAFIVEARRIFPNAKITLSLCSNYMRGVPADIVDRIHVVYGSDRRNVSILKQIRRMKELGEHDLLFDFAATPRSIWLCLLTKAKLKIGFPYKHVQRLLFYDAAVLRSDMRFEADSMLDALAMFGFYLQYPPTFDMPGETLVRSRPYILYFPSASIPNKCWPKKSFCELIDRLSDQYPDCDHVVLKGIADWESVDEIMEPLSGRENVLALDLQEFESMVSLVKGAILLVSNDTGIRNVAITCDTPTVGIFFFTPAYRYWPRYGLHDVVLSPGGDYPPIGEVFDATVRAISLIRDEQYKVVEAPSLAAID